MLQITTDDNSIKAERNGNTLFVAAKNTVSYSYDSARVFLNPPDIVRISAAFSDGITLNGTPITPSNIEAEFADLFDNQGGGGASDIPDKYWFASQAARDAYFASHPDELADGLTVAVGPGAAPDDYTFEQYKASSSEWLDATRVFRGPRGYTGTTGATGATGPAGQKGDTGNTGPAGEPGEAATIASVTAQTVSPATPASVEMGGTAQARTLAFKIPQGLKGDTGDKGDKGDKGDSGQDASNLQPCGLWNASTQYYLNDPAHNNLRDGVVGSDGNMYAAVADSLGEDPTLDVAQAYWVLWVTKGVPGDKGDTGNTGPKGDAPVLIAGTVSTLPPGQPVSVSVSPTGNPGEYQVNVGIPRGYTGADGEDGADGQSPTVAIGTVTYTDDPTQASVTNSGTDMNIVLDFVIPRGEKGEQGETGFAAFTMRGNWSASVSDYVKNDYVAYNVDGNGYVAVAGNIPQGTVPTNTNYWQRAVFRGATGEKGTDGSDGQNATISIGTVTTVAAGQPAWVQNAGSQTNAILNFGIPKGADGAQGQGTGSVAWDSLQGALLNGSGTGAGVKIRDNEGNVLTTEYIDVNNVLQTGQLLLDMRIRSNTRPKVRLGGQSTDDGMALVSDITAEQEARDTAIGAAVAIEAQDRQTADTAINAKIPAAASDTNQLADKDFVNSSIQSNTANFVTCDAAGGPFPTKADLTGAAVYYHNGAAYIPTKNDYAVVVDDEDYGGAQTRYVFTGSQWSFQYKVNDTPFTAAQNESINSGITASKVESYDAHLTDTDNPHGVTAEQAGASPLNTTLTDSGASTTLPAIASGTLVSKIQAIRNNLKALFSYFTNGVANSAAKLSTARTIALTGAVTGSGSFDGAGNLSIATAGGQATLPTITGSGSASISFTLPDLGSVSGGVFVAEMTDDSGSYSHGCAIFSCHKHWGAISNIVVLAQSGVSVTLSGGVVTITNSQGDAAQFRVTSLMGYGMTKQ